MLYSIHFFLSVGDRITTSPKVKKQEKLGDKKLGSILEFFRYAKEEKKWQIRMT
jgi:hypothetical protein